MPLSYDRGNGISLIRVFQNDLEIHTTKEELVKLVPVQAIIRIRLCDYPSTAKPGTLLTHFGLTTVNEFASQQAILAKIVEHGFFRANGDELPPLLSFQEVWLSTIEQCIEQTSYDDLPADCFDNTIGDVTDLVSLKAAILGRYSDTLPDLSKEQILEKGVSLRYLRLLKKITLTFPS